MQISHIRNFGIIAHIDHGKSTLADRFLEITGTLDKRDMKNGQMLDTMELEQERGITIKLQPVRMQWKGYEMNIIDTPGHVDFQYEVSRSLASVEGAILVVDATQGIEAQTLSNVYMAIENDLDIIPVINKVDLPAADIPKVSEEIINLLGCDEADIIPVSAKTGQNVEAILDAVIERISQPKVFEAASNVEKQELKALVFDSQYDSYRGVVSYIKVFQGEVKKGDTL
ncbi:GTP-binding protein, partial [Candidatus Gracilibacteria bacterium]|nr:GTP-binding protein [Candidatus Gracilibacteria bacterium]